MYSSLDDRWVFVSGTMLWSAATNLFLQAVKFLNNINLNNIEFRIINSLWLLFVALCPPFRLLLIIVKSHNLVVHTFRPALHFSSIQAWFRAALKCRFRNYCFVEVNRRKCSKTCLKIRPTIQLAQLRSFIESNSDTESIILDIQQYCIYHNHMIFCWAYFDKAYIDRKSSVQCERGRKHVEDRHPRREVEKERWQHWCGLSARGRNVKISERLARLLNPLLMTANFFPNWSK